MSSMASLEGCAPDVSLLSLLYTCGVAHAPRERLSQASDLAPLLTARQEDLPHLSEMSLGKIFAATLDSSPSSAFCPIM